MKRYTYILFAMLSFFVLSCENEPLDEKPVYKDAGLLEVSFVYKEPGVKSIILSPAFQTIEVEAKLNIEGVKWKVISDQPWCIVDDDVIHEGSGFFEITVVANEVFDEREPAVVSLCAGEYKADLRVRQMGNVFIMDQVFGLGMKTAGEVEIMVKVEEGMEWTTRQPDWMEVNKVKVSEANGEAEYKMTVKWKENQSASKLGVVELYRDGDDLCGAKYALWQFGDSEEYDFEAEGNIRLSSRPSADRPLEIKTPSSHIDSLKCPEWVQIEKVENSDTTTSWLLYFEPNPSDCNSYRETQLSYITLNTKEEKQLSTIFQNYYPVGGLITAKGFALFAEKFNAGGKEAVNEWIKDGVVNVLSMVDMSALEGKWVPIGTEEHPFDLKFNGDERTISGLTASEPLFGVCDGADIYKVVLDKSCVFNVSSDCNSDIYIASLARKILNTKINECSSAAKVGIDARLVLSGADVYAGGLVAYAGPNSVISHSINEGALDIAVQRASSDGEIHIGGVAAYSEGSIKASNNTGKITDNSMAKSHYVGGLVGTLNAALDLDCSDMPVTCDLDIKGFDGGGYLMAGGMIGAAKKELNLKSPKWNGNLNFHMPSKTTEKENVCIGGVLGIAEDAGTVVEGAETSGTIKVFAVRTIYWKVPTAIGGILGCASNGCKVSGSVNNAALAWDATSKSSSAGGVVSSGGIVGRIDKGVAVISDCTNNGAVHNILTHDAKWQSGKLLGARTGGIIGTYGYVRKNNDYDMDVSAFEPSTSNNITITDCNTTSEVLGHRGLVGGIAGCLYNATVINCSYTGISSKSRNNCNVGGVAGAVEKTNIKNCTVKASLYGVAWGSCEFKAGGIAAYLYTDSHISDCRYFGHITTGDNKNFVAYYGGVVGEAQEGCSVTNCSYGGSILNETITPENYADYMIGNKGIVPQNCSYWDGE